MLIAVAALAGVAGIVVGVLAATGVWRSHGPALSSVATGRTVVVTTAADSIAYLEVGRTGAYGVFAAPSGPSRTHTFRLDWLEPGRRYHVRAVTIVNGVTRLGPDQVVAAPPASGPRALRLDGGRFLLDGRPWIPRFTWGSCASDYAEEAALGIDAFMSSGCGDSPAVQADAAARVGAVVIPALDQVDRSLPTTVATYLRDEADLNGVSALELQQNLQQFPDAHGLPVFETFSRLAATVDGRNAIRYSDYVALADAVGIDVYPVRNSGDPAGVGDVASAQRDLQQLAAGKPTYQWIEATGPADDPNRVPTPQEIEAEAWMAITNGARGIGWWTVGDTPFSVSPGARRALRHVDTALDTFAPALQADVSGLTLGDPGVDAFATLRDGALTVFAVNPSPNAVVSEVFTLRGLDGRPVQVWGRGQTLASSGDSFTDTLPPLAWRIYVVAPI